MAHLKTNLLPANVMNLPPTDALDGVLRAAQAPDQFVLGRNSIITHLSLAFQI
jgi:hypothetical protein